MTLPRQPFYRALFSRKPSMLACPGPLLAASGEPKKPQLVGREVAEGLAQPHAIVKIKKTLPNFIYTGIRLRHRVHYVL